MKYFLSIGAICTLLLSAQTTFGQYLQDLNGKPVMEINHVDVEGSPYLFDDWKKGVVKLKNGKTYKDVDLKLNVLSDEVLFKDAKGNTLVFVDEVSEFKIGDVLMRAGYQASEGRTEKSFYQVLSDGGTTLLKRQSKSIVEEKPFNSATVQKKILSTESYYLARNNQLVKVKKDKKAILEALGEKSVELEKYIASNKLNLKEERDMSQLLNYYNSL